MAFMLILAVFVYIFKGFDGIREFHRVISGLAYQHICVVFPFRVGVSLDGDGSFFDTIFDFGLKRFGIRGIKLWVNRKDLVVVPLIPVVYSSFNFLHALLGDKVGIEMSREIIVTCAERVVQVSACKEEDQ